MRNIEEYTDGDLLPRSSSSREGRSWVTREILSLFGPSFSPSPIFLCQLAVCPSVHPSFSSLPFVLAALARGLALCSARIIHHRTCLHRLCCLFLVLCICREITQTRKKTQTDRQKGRPQMGKECSRHMDRKERAEGGREDLLLFSSRLLCLSVLFAFSACLLACGRRLSKRTMRERERERERAARTASNEET